MQFSSLIFMVFVLVGALVAQPLRGPWRVGAIIVLNLIFAASFIASPMAAVPLILFILAGYLALMLVERRKFAHAVGLSVAVLVAVFIWLKQYPFVAAVPDLPFVYSVVGLSYVLFRLLHLIFEVGDGAMQRPSLPRYLAYLTFFPAFLSGPIHRFEPFNLELDTPVGMDADQAFATLGRFLIGLSKVSVLGALLQLVQNGLAARLADAAQGGGLFSAALFAASAGLYLVFLYFNFSGYTDMAIAVARLFGIILPENFRQPFKAANLQDFWSRWHMTLSDWLKLYFFNPLFKALISRFSAPSLTPVLASLALFIVFVVQGTWHGASWGFVLSGVLLGTGISANYLFQSFLTKRLGKKGYRELAARPLYVWTARGLTWAWVALSISPFWCPLETFAGALGGGAMLNAVLVVGAMTIAFALGILAFALLDSWIVAPVAARPGVAGLWQRPWVRVVLIAVAIFLLTFAIPLVGSSNDFVYQGF